MKLKKIITIFVGILMLSSCEDILDTTPTTAILPEDMMTDLASVEVVMNGVYSAFQSDYIVGGYGRMADGVYSDELSHVGSYPDLAELWGNAPISSNLYVLRPWRDMYMTIYRANKFIELISDLSDDVVSADIKAQYVGEAKFIRAYMYFRLVNFFGGVPLRLEALKDDFSNKNMPRSSESEVYAQIISDLQDAVVVDDQGAPYRVSKDAVYALQAKVYLYTGDYASAITAAEHFAYTGTSAHGALEANYDDLWGPNASSSESILQIDFTTDDSNYLSWFFRPSPQRGEVSASPQLLAAFEAGDERESWANYGGYITKYYDDANGADKPYILRLADIYLVYAEALCRQATPDYATATTYINYVRNRAGLAPVPTVTAANFEAVIMQERNVELFAEGERWFDLKRTGLAESVISSKPATTWADVQASYLYWPIPQDEIDSNNDLTASDQNPGY